MNTVTVDILAPEAEVVLEELVSKNLIVVRKRKTFNEVLHQLRRNAEYAPSLEEITKEVEEVRSQRYGIAM